MSLPISPRRIPGRWSEGFALDLHTEASIFLGYDEHGLPTFETKRTQLGEQVYRFKYKSESTALISIVESALSFIQGWGQQFDLLVAVPPSRRRAKQPLFEIVDALSKAAKIRFGKDCLFKTRETPELKNVYDFDQRL